MALESLEGRMLLSGGQLDQTFGSAGVVTSDLGGTEQVTDEALQADGKIVVVGSTTLGNGDFFVVRYNANGTLDSTFGQGGVVPLDFGGTDSASSVAIQPSDGKIVVAGTSSLGQNFAVARLNTDGSLDTTFGRNGIVTTDLGGNDVAHSVAIEANGEIVVAGGSDSNSALVQYQSNGTPDPAFGNAGKVVIDLSGAGAANVINSVLIQGNGNILTGGSSGSNFELASFTPQGGLDNGFGTNGKTNTPISGRIASIHDMAFEPGGVIIAVGDALDNTKGNDDFAIASYSPDGQLNSTFGTGGVTLSDFSVVDVANGVVIQTTNDKIDVAGVSTPGTFQVARYNPDGNIDTSFGTNGTVSVPLGSGAAIAFESSDAKIVVAGTAASDIRLARYFIGNPFGDFSFSNASYNTRDGAGSVTITVNRLDGSQGDAKVNFSTSDGSASAGVQYTPVSGTLDFPAGVTTRTFTIPILADNIVDGTTTVNLTLSSPQGGASLGDTPNAVLNIQDAPGALQFTAASFDVTGNSRTALITVTRTIGDGGQVTVDFTTSDGTAKANVDYIPAAGTLVFPDGVLTASFPITILSDPQASGTLTVNLKILNPTNGATLGSPTDAVLNIETAPGNFQLINPNPNDSAFPNFSAQVDTGTATITVQRLDGSDGAATVDFATSDGTAKANVNYLPTSGTLSFAAGQTSATFPIKLIANGKVNGNLSVNLTLSNPTGGTTLGGRQTAQLIIIDSPGKLQFDSQVVQVQESAGQAFIAVSRSVGVGGLVTVNFSTASGTAAAGTDFKSVNGTLTFAPGELAKLIAVPIMNDHKADGVDKTFTITLSSPTGGASLGTQNTTTVQILDAQQPRPLGDYNSDGKTELAVYRPPTGEFFIQGVGVVQLGHAGVLPVPGNYDGAGKSEVAVYDPNTATWSIQGANVTHVIQFGQPHVDIPVPGDYDGDGTTDLAVFRPTTGQWFIKGSTVGSQIRVLGQPGDTPVPGDYDHDGLADVAVYRASTGQWFIQGSSQGGFIRQFGAPGLDKPIPGNYDGNGQADLAIYRPTTSQWIIIHSTGGASIVPFGQPNVDIPMPGDYDGDGKTDLAVYRPPTAQWFIQFSGGGATLKQFGQANVDIPAQPPVALRQLSGGTTSAIASRSVAPAPGAAVNGGSILFNGPVGAPLSQASLQFAVASTPVASSAAAHDSAIDLLAGTLGTGKKNRIVLN